MTWKVLEKKKPILNADVQAYAGLDAVIELATGLRAWKGFELAHEKEKLDNMGSRDAPFW